MVEWCWMWVDQHEWLRGARSEIPNCVFSPSSALATSVEKHCATTASLHFLQLDSFCFRFGRAASGARSVNRCISPRTCNTFKDQAESRERLPPLSEPSLRCGPVLVMIVFLHLQILHQALMTNSMAVVTPRPVQASRSPWDVPPPLVEPLQLVPSWLSLLPVGQDDKSTPTDRKSRFFWVVFGCCKHLLLLFALQFIRNGIHLATDGEMPNPNQMNTRWICKSLISSALPAFGKLAGSMLKPAQDRRILGQKQKLRGYDLSGTKV